MIMVLWSRIWYSVFQYLHCTWMVETSSLMVDTSTVVVDTGTLLVDTDAL
jgi:hypothetical protein